MKGTAHLQHKCSAGAGCFQFFTCHLDPFDASGYDKLSGAVIIGRDYDFTYLPANIFYFDIVEPKDGSHGSRFHFTCLLHRLSPCRYQPKPVFKGKGFACHKRRKFTKGMPCHHVGFEVIAECGSQDHRVQENCRLGYIGLAKIFIRAGKHQVGNPETQYFIRFFKHLLRKMGTVIKIFTHSHKLGALPRKHISFHKFTISLFRNFTISLFTIHCLFPVSQKPQKEQEQVDKIQVKGQRPENTQFSCVGLAIFT